MSVPYIFSTPLKGVIDDDVQQVFHISAPCTEDSNAFNLQGRQLKLEFRRTVRPIDLAKAYIRIAGKIEGEGGLPINGARFKNYNADAGQVVSHAFVKVFSSMIYESFARATLEINGTVVEDIQNLSLFTEMRKAFMDQDALKLGRYEDACLFSSPTGTILPPVLSTEAGAGKITNGPRTIPGTYSLETRSHILAADGSYEFWVPLSFLFETFASFGPIYSQLSPVIKLERTNKFCTGVMWAGYADAAFNTTKAAVVDPVTPAVVYPLGRLTNTISKLSLEYDEYDPSISIEKPILQQYVNGSAVVMPCRKWSGTMLTYRGKTLNTEITLSSSVHGSILLCMIPIVDAQSQQIRSANAKGYLPERLSLDSIRVCYGRHIACNVSDLAAKKTTLAAPPADIADLTDTVFAQRRDYEHGVVQAVDTGGKVVAPVGQELYWNQSSLTTTVLYRNYVEACTFLGGRECAAMTFQDWRDKFPAICVDLSKYVFCKEEITRQLTLNLTHDDGVADNVTRKMYVALLSANVINYDPISRSVQYSGV